jgi:hypothetical protein
MIHKKLAAAATLGTLMVAAHAAAQDAGGDALAQANNPLANSTSLNLQNLYTGNLTGIEEPANSVLLRAAQPFQMFGSTVITRLTLPINTFPDGAGDHESGVGDLNFFAAYLIDTGNPAISFGLGPQITAPTAADDALGSGKWSAGFANVLFNASSKTFQYGYLLTWQASFAGGEDRSDVNVAAFQPFLFYQLGGGTYLRSTGVMTYDFERDAYAVPVGLGIGQVVQTERGVLNLFVEPQYSVATSGDGQSEWGVFGGLNFQF